MSATTTPLAPARPAALLDTLSRLLTTARAAHEARRTRRIMDSLDPHLCADIGHTAPKPAHAPRAAWTLSTPR